MEELQHKWIPTNKNLSFTDDSTNLSVNWVLHSGDLHTMSVWEYRGVCHRFGRLLDDEDVQLESANKAIHKFIASSNNVVMSEQDLHGSKNLWIIVRTLTDIAKNVWKIDIDAELKKECLQAIKNVSLLVSDAIIQLVWTSNNDEEIQKALWTYKDIFELACLCGEKLDPTPILSKMVRTAWTTTVYIHWLMDDPEVVTWEVETFIQSVFDKIKFWVNINPEELSSFNWYVAHLITNEFINACIHDLSSYIEQQYSFKADKYLNTVLRIQLDAWNISGSWASIKGSLHLIKLLENPIIWKKGIELLQKEYGITEFYRYDESDLEEMLQYEGQDVPYGIVITAESDWNGAFIWTLSLKDTWLKEEWIATRHMQVSSLSDLQRKLVKLNQKYWWKNKINFAVVHMHGNKDGMYPSEDENQVISIQWDVEHKGSLARFLSDSCPIILFSCSTWQAWWIAEKISTLLWKKVIAPNKPTSWKVEKFIFSPHITWADVSYEKDEELELYWWK